ncbi:Mitochondrial import receptor subunit TOM70, partial [Trachymyrmex zeteki]
TPLQTAQKYKNAGNVRFQMGKYNEAIAQYNKAINVCPKENVDDLAIFYQNRAAAYEELKKYSSVKADCTKALELNPKYTKALLRRARILEQLGDFEAALKDIAIACIHENFSDQISLLKAEIILAKLDPVLSRLEHSENIPEFFKKPLQALKNKEYHNIIPLCTEVIESPGFDKLPSSKLEVVLLRATFNLFRCNYCDAINDFEIILSSKDAFDDIRVNALIKRANLHREIGIRHLTFKDFELAIMINPSCSDIYYHRGQAYLNIQRLDEAKRDFEKAVELNPNFSAAHMQKWYANYHFAVLNGDLSLAKMTVRDIEKAFDKYSNPPECVCCYVLYGQIMSVTQQYQKADTYFVKAIEKDPNYAIVYMRMWKCNFNNIEKYLHKALTLDTLSIEGKTWCIVMLIFAEIERGNIKKAIKLSDKALAFCRTFKELLFVYSVDHTKIFIDINNQFAHIIRFLRSYSRFIGIQNAGESDKHISIDSDGPSKVLSPAAESETPSQRAQKYKNEGNVYFKMEKYNEAIAKYNKAIDICPKENKDELATFYQNRAAAYEQLKKYGSVKADCTKALELNPKYIKALLRRARVLEQTGDLETALKDMTTAYPVLSRLEHPENIPKFFKKPLQALKNKEYHNIIPLCTEVIESPGFDKLPSSKLEVVLLRATFNLFRCNYCDAINDFEIILSSKDAFDDIRVNALIKRANLHREIGIRHLTFKDFELAIMINPSCSDIYYHRGQAYLNIQRLDEAKRDFEKAVELNPNFSAAHMQKWYANYHFAVLNRDLSLAEMTVRDIKKAFDKYSNPPECVCCYVLYGQIMFKTQQYQKGDAYFVKAIEKDPDYAIVYLLLWNCNLDNTLEYLNKVLKLETCSIEGKLRCIEMLRTIEIQRGNIEEAIKLSDKALKFCRTLKELLYIYGVNAIKVHLNIKNRFGYIIHFLRSYSRVIDIQNAEESYKRIPSNRPSKVPSPAAESEVKSLI